MALYIISIKKGIQRTANLGIEIAVNKKGDCADHNMHSAVQNVTELENDN